MDNLYWLILIIGTIVAATLAFIWVAVSVKKGGGSSSILKGDATDAAHRDVEHLFDDDFRQELRNRGKLHFENILNENAMFLQQDLRLTTSQLNDYMKDEITKVLKEEFSRYEESINAAKDQAIQSIKRTQEAIEQQRQILEEQLKQQVETERQQIIAKFEAKMGEIVNYYVLEALSGELDVSDQMEYIFSHLEANKQAIIEDIRSGA